MDDKSSDRKFRVLNSVRLLVVGVLMLLMTSAVVTEKIRVLNSELFLLFVRWGS